MGPLVAKLGTAVITVGVAGAIVGGLPDGPGGRGGGGSGGGPTEAFTDECGDWGGTLRAAPTPTDKQENPESVDLTALT